MALSLLNGKVIFQFNLGESQVALTSQDSITMDEWHTVSISRRGVAGELVVDDQELVFGRATGRLSSFDLEDRFYLGGHPYYGDVRSEVTARSGFVGCIRHLSIRPEYDLDLYDDALRLENVGRCEGDEVGCPCQSGEVCVLRTTDFICYPADGPGKLEHC